MSSNSEVHLGYEVGTGRQVLIPVAHMCVVGQTQASGKTTTLEALASRLEEHTVLAFVTKRGEGSFIGDTADVQPYFRDRADWQFVDGLLEAQLREKNKFLRPWIMKICRTTKTLADVHEQVKKNLKKAKGLNEGVYTQLDEYLNLIVPEIGRTRLSRHLTLTDHRLNVMQLGSFQTPMQMLFVQSAVDYVNENRGGTIVVVPEAWEFIPEGKGSPVKQAAVTLVRKGAGIQNFIWVDSQDTAGMSKEILRGCTVWLLGVQREANEIKRNLSNIPAGVAKPKPADIAQLGKGEFFACWKNQVVRVYVQPAWMKEGEAIGIATRTLPIESVKPPAKTTSEVVMQSNPPAMPDQPSIQDQLNQMMAIMQRITGGIIPQPSPPPAANPHVRIPVVPVPPAEPLTEYEQRIADNEQVGRSSIRPADTESCADAMSRHDEELFQKFRARLLKDPAVIHALARVPVLEVEFTQDKIVAMQDSMQGRLAKMLAEGFFEKPVSGSVVQKDLKRRGIEVSPGTLYPALKNLATLGFLFVTEGEDDRGRKRDEYQAVPGMKVHIIKK